MQQIPHLRLINDALHLGDSIYMVVIYLTQKKKAIHLWQQKISTFAVYLT